MERLSVAEVSDLLRAHGFPEVLIRDFSGKNRYISGCSQQVRIQSKAAVFIFDLFFLFSDNYIDGAALIGLKEDFTEFKEMVPQSGLRLKLKGLIGKAPSMIHVSSLNKQ